MRKLYKSTGYTTYSDSIDHTLYEGSYIQTLACAEDDDGYLYFGLYQLEFEYMFRGGPFYSKLPDKQHVHSIHVDRTVTPNEVYASIDDVAVGYGPLCIKTSDHGLTWTQVPVPYQNRDYFPLYCGNGYKLGGGEANILGGATLYKTTNEMDEKTYYTGTYGKEERL